MTMPHPKRAARLALAIATLGAVPAAAATPAAPSAKAAASATSECGPEGGLKFLCGIASPEDVAPIPGTRWLVTGSFAESPTGGLYAIDADNPALTRLYPAKGGRSRPDRKRFPDCARPPEAGKFSALGLSIRPRAGGGGTAYVVGGGARHGIEIFELDMVRNRPQATWVGCVAAPAGATLNGVAGMSDGEILTTAIFEAPHTFQDALKGQPTGNVYFRRDGGAFEKVPGTNLPGDNGIEVTRDHRWMFVAVTGTREVLRYDRENVTAAPARIALPFGPDNLRWSPDHELLVVGQERPASCAAGSPCPGLANVTAIDPVSLATRTVARFPVTSGWSGLSGAAIMGDTIWLGSHRGDRIAYRPLHPASEN